MKRLLIAIVLVLTGCNAGYQVYGVTPANSARFQKDDYDCYLQALSAHNADLVDPIRRRCMQLRGWTVTQ